MPHDQFGVGARKLVFADPAIELGHLVPVVGDVGVHAPHEILVLDDVGGQAQLDAAVGHVAHVVPAVAETVGGGVGNGNLHEHGAVLLVVEFDVHVQAVPEAQVHGQVGDPQLLPLQVFVARL